MTAPVDSLPATRWTLWLPLGVSAGLWLAFIGSSGFDVAGERHFSLFDDAMISMTYARTFAGGDGLVWFPGADPVEGYTNLAWTLWMALLHLLPVAASKASLLVMLSGAAVLGANLVVVHAITRRVFDSVVATTLAVWLTGLAYPLVFWTLRGMEVGLVALLISCAVLLALRLRDAFSARDAVLFAVVMVLGVLTRTDAIAPLGLVALFALGTVWSRGDVVRRAAVAVAGLGALAGAFGGHTLFRIAYYGDALPNTYYLKLGGVDLGERLLRGLASLAYVGALQLWAGMAFAVVLLVVMGRRLDPAGWLLATVFAVQAAYSVYVGADAWEWMGYANRYLATGLPALMILAAGGIAAVATGPRRRQLTTAASMTVVAAGAVVVQLRQKLLPLELLQVEPEPLPVAVLATLAVPLAVAAVVLRRDRGQNAGTVQGFCPRNGRRRDALVLGVAAVAALNGPALVELVHDGAAAADDDARMTRYGVTLRGVTAPDATVAVVWAGAIPYFSRRPAIDLLGKSDPVVAHLEPRDAPLRPGHSKWNYDYSIGVLRPDVVAQVYSPGRRTLRRIAEDGYTPVAFRVFVRDDTTAVDAGALAAALAGDWHATLPAQAQPPP